MRPAWYAIPLLILGACSLRREPPEALYRDASSLRRAGRLEDALKESDRGLSRYPDRSTVWHWRFRLLSAELLLDRGETRQALKLLEEAAPPPDPDLQARREMDRGDACYWLSRRNQARAHLEQAEKLAEPSSDLLLQAQIEIRHAVVQDTFEQTDACYRNALRLASRAQDLFLMATAYGGLGYNRVRHSRYDEAMPWLEASRISAEKSGARRLLGNTLGNLGTAYAGLGDYDRGLRLLDQAATIAGELGDKRGQQYWLSNMGDLYQRRRDFNNAIRCQRLAWVLAEDRQDLNWLAATFTRLAETYLDAGDVDSASQFNDRALALRGKLEDSQVLLYAELLGARIDGLRQPFPVAQAALRSVIASATRQDEMRVLWEAHASLASLLRTRQLPREAESEYRAAIATIDREWYRLSNDESKITFLAHLIRFYQQYVDFLMSLNQPADALRVAESARARVLEQRLNSVEAPEAPHSVPELQSSLRGTRTALLLYSLAPERSFGWLVTADSFTPFRLPPDTELTSMVEEYNSILLNRHDPLERAYPVRARLYEVLLKPILSRIRPDASVVVVPDGALHNLNFETLVVEGDHPHYWIDDVTLSVAPSLGALRFVRSSSPGHPRLLFIGDPVPPGKDYPPLAHLKDEREVLERSFPPGSRRVYTGLAATPAAYRNAEPSRFDVIHFAAHATPNPESPLNSAVVLSPNGETYKLYAKDVLDLPIEARLVTISACRGAGPRVYSGEGLMGFSWAFLEAGAQNVIAGLWDVDDAATSQLMGDLYAKVARGAPPAPALRAAKLSLLHSGTLYRKPFFWAPFELFTRFVHSP